MSLKAHPLVRDWLRRDGDRLQIRTGKVDIGQRITSALVQIVRDELHLPSDRIALAPVTTADSPDEGITSGSNSVEQSGHAIRCAAATLRRAMIAAAVDRSGGDPDDWTLDDGLLRRPGSNDPLDLLDLMEGIDADLAVDPEAAMLTARDTAPSAAMLGLAEMVRGTFTFVHDLEAPGMLHARVIRPPHAHARLRSIPEDEISALDDKGLRLVRDGSFLAVAGPREWPVIRAAERLARACDWDAPDFPNIDVFDKLTREGASTRLPVDKGQPLEEPVPDPPGAPDYTARYEKPYLMHAALGPSAAMAVWDGDRLEIKTHSQGIYPLRISISDSFGLSEDKVVLTHVPGSGCYGHNGADDAAFEAALVARAIPDTPILLKWTRAEEHGWEPFAPAMAVEVAATLEQGRVASWSAEAFSDTHRGRPRPGPNRVGPSRLVSNRHLADPIPAQPGTPNMNREGGMHRNLDPIYTFAERRLVKNLVTGLPHRTSALRCLGAVANVFALESSMDDLAIAAGEDPIAYRLAQLDDPRAIAVLETLRDRIADLSATAEGQGRGIAYAQYKNAMTRVGLCIDVTVTDLAEVRLDRVVMVADAGRVVDLAGLIAQLEGGVIQGASWALCEEVQWDRDGVTSLDWDSYPVLRFDNLPTMDVHVLDQPTERPLGAGEASPGPTVAAIANAVHDAMGMRLRRLPFTADAIMQAAANA